MVTYSAMCGRRESGEQQIMYIINYYPYHSTRKDQPSLAGGSSRSREVVLATVDRESAASKKKCMFKSTRTCV